MRALRTLAARMTRLASLPMKGWAAALTIVAATKASVTSPNESDRRKLTPLGTRQLTLAQNHRHRQCLACCHDPLRAGPALRAIVALPVASLNFVVKSRPTRPPT
jgi:hypothetical protein